MANKHRFEFLFRLHEGHIGVAGNFFCVIPCNVISLMKKNMTVKISIYLQFPPQPVLLYINCIIN